ncbi:hypothetical protein FQZ97_1200990 [compost metagenome]
MMPEPIMFTATRVVSPVRLIFLSGSAIEDSIPDRDVLFIDHSGKGIWPTLGCAARTDPGYQPNSIPSRYTAGARSTPYRATPRSAVGCAARTDSGFQPTPYQGDTPLVRAAHPTGQLRARL